MKRKTAAEYCDMTEAAFEREVFSGRFPASVLAGGREHWRKDALDAAIDRLSGEGSDVPAYRRKTMERYGQKAA